MPSVTDLSAYALWALLIASLAYKLRGFDTPFGDSLTPEQRLLKDRSACQRRDFFVKALVAACVAIWVWHGRTVG
jgi:hypothetical protein